MMTISKLTLVGTLTLSMAACADKSDQIAASYVSPNMYSGLTCSQLAIEAQSVANRAAEASAVQDKKASNDAVVVGVGAVLFWPALFMIKGDGAQAAEVGRLKGEKRAIEQASMQKNCNIRFTG